MPSTLSGLLIFLALLAPGFTFVLVTERGRGGRRTRSVLQETAGVALGSVVFGLLALALAVGLANLSPIPAPDVNMLVDDGADYARATFRSTALWAIGILVGACLLAAIFGGIVNNINFNWLRSRRPVRWLFPSNSGTEFVSGWWKALVDQRIAPGRDRLVSCYLDDGSMVRGLLRSANNDAQEGPERDLVLSGPFVVRDAKGNEDTEPVGAAIVSASRIVYIHVAYVDKGSWLLVSRTDGPGQLD